MISLFSSFTWSHSPVCFWPVSLQLASFQALHSPVVFIVSVTCRVQSSLLACEIFHVITISSFPSAGKFEEREDRVPKLETLNGLGCMSSMNLVLTKQGLLHMELLLLETFQWNLYLPTAAHFIEYYLSIAVHDEDLHDGWPMACLGKTKLYMVKYADYFLEVSLQGKLHLI